MKDTIHRHIRYFIEEARTDLISLGDLIDAANEASDAEIGMSRVERTLLLVRRILAEGFRAGHDMTGPAGFEPWPDQSPDAVGSRIEDIWRGAGWDQEPYAGMLVWFDRPASRL